MEVQKLRQRTCCFTGHRFLPTQHKKEIEDRTAAEIRNMILQKDVCFFGVGGAIGFDTLAAEVLFRLRENEYPHIKVILVYPFKGFTSHWTSEQKAKYKSLLQMYDKVVCISDDACKEAYLARDRHLVDCSSYCIAYCTRNYGGTAYTVRYAKKQGLSVRNVFEICKN